MSFNNKYNTRNSGRYNTPGQFVSAGELAPGAGRGRAQPPLPPTPQPPRATSAPNYTTAQQPQQVMQQQKPVQQQNQYQQQQQQQQNQFQQQQNQFTPNQFQQQGNLTSIETHDVEMKTEKSDGMEVGAGDGERPRPFWMKNKLAGVKKLSNKERRRRQNETLRRLLSPKNALMVLNEMMPGEQVSNQFKVEPAGQFNTMYKNPNQHSFCADLTVDGHTYKGYGSDKMTARNAAAEQAIRDIIIKKMHKVMSGDGASEGGSVTGSQAKSDGKGEGSGGEGEEGDEETLPMIQLASFALHKLFSEWEYEGHKVPQLKPHGQSQSESEAGTPGAANSGAGAQQWSRPRPPAAPKKPRTLPLNAPAMHPCMLLTYMRPNIEYREIAAEGDRPQNMIFTFGVDVDGATYIGKASNKKEARKQAAKAACQAMFNVRFNDVITANAPVPRPE